MPVGRAGKASTQVRQTHRDAHAINRWADLVNKNFDLFHRGRPFKLIRSQPNRGGGGGGKNYNNKSNPHRGVHHTMDTG
jgi:hypothetical protein